MKKFFIVILMMLFATTIFADRFMRDNKGRRIKLLSNNTYVVIFDGEIVKDGKGRKILLRDNKTWDYVDDVIDSGIYDDEDGKKVWIKNNGTWGYIKKIENSNFSYKNVAFDDTGRRTIFSGRINNNSGKDYRSATFNLIVFDKESFEYKRAGTFVINDFFAGDTSEFETSIMIQSRDIADYYIEFAGGEERRKEREIEKKKKGKKIIELKMELN